MKQLFGLLLSCAIALAVSHSPSFAGLSFSLIGPAIGIAVTACGKTSTRKSCLSAKPNKTKATKPAAAKSTKSKATKAVAAKSSKSKAAKAVAAKSKRKQATKLAAVKSKPTKRSKPVVTAAKTGIIETSATGGSYASRPIETICGDALNAERADWRTDSPIAPDEARRRGETVSSCRAILNLPAQSPPEEYAITVIEGEVEGETAQH